MLYIYTIKIYSKLVWLIVLYVLSKAKGMDINMKIKNIAIAGTMESCDVMVTVKPNNIETVEIQINSPVKYQFGKQIRSVVENTLKEMNVTNAVIRIDDYGALDCIIKARLETAVLRAAEAKFDWKGEAK